MKLDISAGVKGLRTLITVNSPVLLTGTAIAGVVATGVLAARGGYKARGIVDEAQAKQPTVPLNNQDKVKLTWLCYAAPAATGLSSIASVAGVHLIHTKRHAALAGLYAMATTKLDDVSEKAEEMLGPKKALALREEVAQKSFDRMALNPDTTDIIMTGDGTELTVDGLAGRPFFSSINKVEAAVNKVNAELGREANVALNDLYEYMNLDPIPLGDIVGWSGSGGDLVEARFDPIKLADGRAVNSVTFQPGPSPTFRRR